MSDHHIVEITTHFKSHFARTQRKQRKFYKTFDTLNFFSDDVDWNQIKSELNQVNLQDEFSAITDPADKLDKFTKICESIAAKHTPKKKVAKVPGKSRIPRKRRILMRRRRKITNQIAKHQQPTMRKKLSRELIDIEMKLQDSFTLSSTIQENKAIQAIKRNPKYFFTYIKKFSKTKPSLGPLLNADKQFVVDNKDMTDILSNQ